MFYIFDNLVLHLGLWYITTFEKWVDGNVIQEIEKTLIDNALSRLKLKKQENHNKNLAAELEYILRMKHIRDKMKKVNKDDTN